MKPSEYLKKIKNKRECTKWWTPTEIKEKYDCDSWKGLRNKAIFLWLDKEDMKELDENFVEKHTHSKNNTKGGN